MTDAIDNKSTTGHGASGSQSGLTTSHDLFTLMKPRFSDFDLQGVLNSRQYLDLVGEARIEQMERHYKLPIEMYTKRKQSWILSQFSIEYLKPIYYPTSFFISTKIETIDRARALVTFSFCSLDKSREYAKGMVVYHLFDMETRKPTSIPDAEKDIYLHG
jgi:thioesterase III